jgi:hypothetical protein
MCETVRDGWALARTNFSQTFENGIKSKEKLFTCDNNHRHGLLLPSTIVGG